MAFETIPATCLCELGVLHPPALCTPCHTAYMCVQMFTENATGVYCNMRAPIKHWQKQ